jgi:Dyp-type peroxidase family
MAPLDADVMSYIASVYEARVNAFIAGLAGLKPDVQQVRLERGYQRINDSEHFGYRDGVRNVDPKTDRPEVVFVHRDGRELDEPRWTDGGSYMAYLKIRQFPDRFAELPTEAQDAAVGRRRDGTRLDLSDVAPADEPADVPVNLPSSSHVRKAGPRGPHDDTQIFRHGLPYMETVVGELRDDAGVVLR